MLSEHLVYSTAIAIIFGMLYRGITGRENSWLIIFSAYAPDIDILAAKIGEVSGLFHIEHGDFHNIAFLLLYAFLISLILRGFRQTDTFIFAAVGFAAHLIEDSIVFYPGYRILWPLYDGEVGFGIFNYRADVFGIADKEVLAVGILLVFLAAFIRTIYEGNGWFRKLVTPESRYQTTHIDIL
ncbi:hypothetical protein DRP07_05650 [Archaeoglobales archaeon]|nr:MAG: hypothetical protein DRP07_05650 [Archaeoglobales archaeon]